MKHLPETEKLCFEFLKVFYLNKLIIFDEIVWYFAAILD